MFKVLIGTFADKGDVGKARVSAKAGKGFARNAAGATLRAAKIAKLGRGRK